MIDLGLEIGSFPDGTCFLMKVYFTVCWSEMLEFLKSFRQHFPVNVVMSQYTNAQRI